MPAVITRAITKKKIKTFKSNNAHSIDGFKVSNLPRKKTTTIHSPTSLLFIGVNATTFEIPARFVNKSYPLIPILLGNPPLGIPIGAVPPHLEKDDRFPARAFVFSGTFCLDTRQCV